MATTFPLSTTPGYKFEEVPDLSRATTRERLSQSAFDGFFAIADRWRLRNDESGQLLGGIPRSSLHRYKTGAGIRSQDELTRISYVVGIYKNLHLLLPGPLADQWMKRENDNPLFAGSTPLAFAIRNGIPGLQQIRSLLDAARGGS